MAENVKVIVRCRPMNKKEQDLKCKNIIKVDDCAVHLENSVDTTTPPKTFTYDSAYDWNASSEVIYNDICYSLVENVLEGYNGTIFAYGQTGCGKSHTMQGPDINPTSIQVKHMLHAQRGIISRSFDHMFESISVATGVRYLALCSYLEIYNENIRDLLNPTENSTNLVLKEQPSEGIFVQNLSTHTVHNAQDCEQLLTVGTRNRIVGATLMNATSSRSHSIFTISLEQIATATKLDEGEVGIKKGKLNLVDLAGSERQNKTGATGDRLKEATKINLSLSALGNVISALVDGKTKHIPYRDSKLTRLLQDSLGGNTKTLMIACISPAAYNYDETLSTLRYASRAKNIHNKPRINEDPKDAMLREYQEEIMKLKQLLQHGGNEPPTNDTSSSSSIDSEKEKLRVKYETDAIQLKTEYNAQLREKEELVKDMEKLRHHYEMQLTKLSRSQELNNNISQQNHLNDTEMVKLKMAELKGNLIGGERANDIQLREKHKKKKIAAEKRLSALAMALSRVEQTEDRDLLQGHYTDIQQELQAKTDSLKAHRQKVRALEREVSDLQAEFQLDRADYLAAIRRLETNQKFYQQLMEKAVPLLRRDGRFWDVDAIRGESVWNDDLKRWKLPEMSMIRVKLPPADNNGPPPTSAPAVSQNSQTIGGGTTVNPQSENTDQKLQRSDGTDITGSYFRPRRAAALIHQNRVINSWKGANLPSTHLPATFYSIPSKHLTEFTKRHKDHQGSAEPMSSNRTTAGGIAWYSKPAMTGLNRTWYGLPTSTSSTDNYPGECNPDKVTSPIANDRLREADLDLSSSSSTTDRHNRPPAATTARGQRPKIA